MYKKARKEAGLTIEEAAFRLHIAPRTLCKYEAGETMPGQEVALAMGQVYGSAELTQGYCRRQCAIGAAYAYEVLNNVDRSPQNILLKLYQVHRDGGVALERLLSVVVNKQERGDFTEGEWEEFTRDLHKLLDLEHAIETLRLALGERGWCDVAVLVSEHNSKCYARGYVTAREHDLVRELEEEYGWEMAV